MMIDCTKTFMMLHESFYFSTELINFEYTTNLDMIDPINVAVTLTDPDIDAVTLIIYATVTLTDLVTYSDPD